MTIHTELQQYIIQQYIEPGPVPSDFSNQFNLIDSGILTSLVLVDLLAHVEATYGIEFGDDDIVPENFATIDDLVEYVKHQSQSQPA